MDEWIPVLYRGDGAWIGIMPDGLIGVGVESEGRASLVASGFIPMWPYMERDISEALDEFLQSWGPLSQGGISSPEKLIELTVESAWKSGRSYWMELSASWALEMSRRKGFDRKLVRMLLSEMAISEVLSAEIRYQAERASE